MRQLLARVLVDGRELEAVRWRVVYRSWLVHMAQVVTTSKTYSF